MDCDVPGIFLTFKSSDDHMGPLARLFSLSAAYQFSIISHPPKKHKIMGLFPSLFLSKASPQNVQSPESYLDFPTKFEQYAPAVSDKNHKKKAG